MCCDEVLRYNLLHEIGVIGFDNIMCEKCDGGHMDIVKNEGLRKKRKDAFLYSCDNRRCPEQEKRTIRLYTIFYGSPKELNEFVDLIYTFACMDLTPKKSSELLGINKDNASKWYMIFGRCISMHMEEHPIVLGGEGRVVEVDESCFTQKKKYGLGSGLGDDGKPARWVLGVCR